MEKIKAFLLKYLPFLDFNKDGKLNTSDADSAKAKVDAVVEEVKPEPVVEPTPEVTAPEPTPVEEEPVEVMSKRGRKAKAEKIAELDHELGIKIHNEPHLEDVYRAEFAEKVAKLK